MTIEIQPTDGVPIPKDLGDEFGASLQDNARVAANTAALMAELGMPFEMTEDDEKLAHDLFKQVDAKKHKTSQDQYNPSVLYQGNVALKLSALLTEYDQRVVLDATQARTYITNRLLEISSCGDARYELKAIELFGKLSDVGAFSEKSEVTITHRTSEDLKTAIADKINRLLAAQAANTIDITPEYDTLEAELGLIEAPKSEEEQE
jgi:nitrate/nitrite-specific signal transduction histidine kinase